MKISTIAILGLACLCLLPFILGEVDRFYLALQEKGTQFTEGIDVDEKQDVEIFRVPDHNDVEGAEFYHDFKKRLTVTRILSRKVCYISELDLTISSPEKLKADLNRAAFETGKLPVVTESSVMMITGPYDRLFLTKEILEFCGALPIYNTEHIKDDASNGNETTIIRGTRQKRDLVIERHKSCLKSVGQDAFKYIKEGGCNDPDINWDLTCKMERRLMHCFYYVTCYNLAPRNLQFNCTYVHRSSKSPTCCDYTCPS